MELTDIKSQTIVTRQAALPCVSWVGRRRGWADCDGWGEMAGPEIADTGADTLHCHHWPPPFLIRSMCRPLLHCWTSTWRCEASLYLSTDFSSRVHSQDWVNQRCIQYPAPVSSPLGLCTLGLSVQRADGRHPHGDARGNRVISYTSAVQAVLGHPVPTLKQEDRDREINHIYKPLYKFLCVCYISGDGENSVVVRWKMQVAEVTG